MKARVFSADGRRIKGVYEIEMDEGAPYALLEGVGIEVGDLIELNPRDPEPTP